MAITIVYEVLAAIMLPASDKPYRGCFSIIIIFIILPCQLKNTALSPQEAETG